MKRILSVLLALTLMVSEAKAQTSGSDIANSCGLAQSCGTILNGLVNGGAASFTSATISTGNITFTTSGKQDVYAAPPVITPDTAYPTPAAAKFLTGRYNIIAAGAPTAAFVSLPAATTLPNGALTYGLFNQGSNPVAIVGAPSDTLNVSAAATPFSCTTLKYCECTRLTTTNWGCTLL